MTSASELQAELTAAFAAASSFKIVECVHCGIRCGGCELYCDCAKSIVEYGSHACETCGIQYGFFEDIYEYISPLSYSMGEEEAIHYARDCYENAFLAAMPKPCECCAEAYKKSWEKNSKSYDAWLAKYRDKFPEDDDDWRYDDYDEPCRAGRGYCHCCGDCP